MSDRRAYCARWTDLPRWDLKSARAAAFRRLHPTFRPLGDFIEEATVTVRPADEPEKLWPVYGVNNRVGVVFSHHQPGVEFHAPYKHIERDWFFHNPTRANVGSLGRVPEVPTDAITSPEYQVWRIRRGLLPDFVEILIRLPFFLDLVECHRVGAVKERLFVENLREIPIPLLTEAEQCGIVERWKAAHVALASAESRIDAMARQARLGFLDDLGIKKPVKHRKLGCFALHWSQVDRWSLNYLTRKALGIDSSDPGKFPAETLAALCNSVSGATPNTRFPSYWNGLIPWVSPKDMKSETVTDTEDHISEQAVSEAGVPRVDRGAVLIVMRSGILQHTVPVALLGMPASINQDIRAFTVRDWGKLLPEFLAIFLQSRNEALLELVKSSTTVQSLNKEELDSFPIPVPPLPEQRALVERVAAARGEIARERAEAARLAAAIAAETEALLLGQPRS